MTQGCILIPRLEQKIQLTQVIKLNDFLAVPDEIIEVVAGTVFFNPDLIERTLQKRKAEKSIEDVAGKVQSIYSSISPCSPNRANLNGMILSPDIRAVEEHIKPYQIEVSPDATYIGRTDKRPEIVFSDSIKGANKLFSLSLDIQKYPETSKLLSQMKKFDEWKKARLRESYVIVGDVQREYFEKFNLSRLNFFVQDHLADRLNLSASTISRVLSNRWVEARDTEGNQKSFYIKDIFATRDNLKKYSILSGINKIFEKEFEQKKAYSDMHILEKLGKDIARRSIANYRKENNIPNHLDRNKIYKSGKLQEQYRIA
ncbi:MAG: hypothetical protein AABW81_03830 [Nanoarchaeota archaeon]